MSQPLDGIPAWPRWPATVWLRQVLVSLVLVPLFRLAYRIDRKGLENVGKPHAPCIIVSNHNMGLDWGILLTAYPRHARRKILGAAGTNEIFGNRLRGFGASLLGAFPFAKEGVRIRHSLEVSRQLLNDGWTVLILPEGERRSDVPMRPFKPGVGWLVAKTGAEVQPLRIDVLKPGIVDGGRWRSPRGHVRVSIGPRIRLDGAEDYREVAEALEQAVRDA